MIIVIVVSFVALLWALREIIVGCWVWKQRRAYRHLYRVEVTQQFFGSARESLIDLVRRGEVEDKSATFQILYFVDTFILRRPEEYSQISNALQTALLGTTERSASLKLQDESKNWSPIVRETVTEHASAIDNLVISHSRFLRYLRMFANFIFKNIPRSKLIRSTYMIAKRVIRKKEDSATQDLRASQEKLLNLARYKHNSLATSVH